MQVVSLYNGIYALLAGNEDILESLGLSSSSSLVEKALHIQKRSKPQNLADNLPLIAFYTPSGGREGRNDNVYVATFTFDVYTPDDVDLAQTIGLQIANLFDDEISVFDDVENFSCRWLTSFESGVDMPNTYCFTTVLELSISVDVN